MPGKQRALDDQVDEPLEAGLLGRAVLGPDAVVARLAVLEVDPAEEVLEPARGLVPGVALEVEPDVAGVWLGHEVEAAVGLEWEVLDAVLGGAAPVELEAGLEAQAVERLGAHLRDARVWREVAELLERRDSRGGEAFDLRPRDAGGERQVVVALPLRLAEREEVAESAVLDRVRVSRRAARDCVEEPSAQPPVEGEVVVRVEALGLASAGDDAHRARHRALDARDLLGVEAELDDVSRPSVPRELGVERLVGAIGLANNEVGEPTPGVVGERRLVDNRRTVAHGAFRGVSSTVPANLPRLADPDDIVGERAEVGSLVLLTLAADEVGVRVVAERLWQLLERDGDLKHRQMRAGNESAEVGGREDKAGVPKLHLPGVSPSWWR
jgi:hypothetical protein